MCPPSTEGHCSGVVGPLKSNQTRTRTGAFLLPPSRGVRPSWRHEPRDGGLWPRHPARSALLSSDDQPWGGSHRHGEYDEGIADLSQAIEIGNELPHCYCCRGRAHFEKGEYARAIADYTESIRLDPSRAIAFHERALRLRSIGRERTAATDRAQAERLQQTTRGDASE